MRHDADLAFFRRAQLDQQATRHLGHDHHPVGFAAQRSQDLELVWLRFRQQRVQRHDERLRQFSCERQHVLAVASAEDSVLMLQQNHVDVQATEQSRGPQIVAPDGLRDRRHHIWLLRARWIVDDHDRTGLVDIGDVE